jgi:hypothetical protein
MKLPLHCLKMVLPAKCAVTTLVESGVRSSIYTWSCGCTAHGYDEAVVDVRCCKPHDVMLTGFMTPGAGEPALQVPE